MNLDRNRLRAILQGDHSYYGGRELSIREDRRWHPGQSRLIAQQLTPAMRVLDVGCGDGGMLLELSPSFHTALGIDTDPEHLQLAEAAQREQGVANVEFRLMDYPDACTRLPPESFDLLTSLRGPLPDTSAGLQLAYRLLRPDGLLFCEEIAELHHREVVEIWEPPTTPHEPLRTVDTVRHSMEQHGFSVRLAADILTKSVYPDVYIWLQYQANIWAWLGRPLPDPEDPRIELFAERYATGTGEITVTNHVVWIAGVKQ